MEIFFHTKPRLYAFIGLTVGKRHAWFDSSVGRIRKQLTDENGKLYALEGYPQPVVAREIPEVATESEVTFNYQSPFDRLIAWIKSFFV